MQARSWGLLELLPRREKLLPFDCEVAWSTAIQEHGIGGDEKIPRSVDF